MMGDDLRFCPRAILMLFSKALLSGVWAGLTFFYIQLWRFNMKAAEKAIATRKKVKDKKLSKWALWWQKNPQGLDVIIHDMRAVMR